MKTRLTDIVIHRRVRRDLGDISSLMESMRTHGLLNPVVINSRNELVAGHRRTEAARRLGWESIETRVVETENETELVEMEIEENTERKNLSTDELAEAFMRLERMKHPSFFRRIWNAIRRFLRRLFRRRPRERSRQRR